MKPEFSEILLPGHRVVTTSSSQSVSLKWIVLLGALFVVTVTGMVAFYEIRFARYDLRTALLEERLADLAEEVSILKRLDDAKIEQYYEEEYGDLEDDLFDDKEEEEEESDSDEHERFGEVKLEDEKETKERSKRQIPVPPTQFFDPTVPRTADGVPILANSYLDKIGAPTPGYIHWSNVLPTQDQSEGLRLYESLVATGGRGEPKSPDYYPRPTSDSGIRPHHRTSAAWVERPQTRSGIELKSGSTGPQFSDDIIYTRSGTGSRSSLSQNQGNTHRYLGSSVNSRGNYSRGTTGAASSQYYSSTGGSGHSSNYFGGGRSGGNTVINRRSRVPATGDVLYPSNPRPRSNIQYPPLRRIGQGDGEVVARVVQTGHDHARPASHVTSQADLAGTAGAHAESRRTYKGARYQNRQGQGGQRRHYGHEQHRRVTTQRSKREYGDTDSASDELNIVKAEAWVEGPKAVAAHYVADSSNLTTQHRHYEGNGRLRNADSIFSSWKPSEWMAGNEASKSAFTLSPTGVLTIRQTGLYYIYAQIHYIDDHDINSFTLSINSTPFLQCTTMTETYNRGSKSNTCFTAGVTLLKENDRILIRDVEVNRYSILKPEKSFFGLMKLNGDIGLPQL